MIRNKSKFTTTLLITCATVLNAGERRVSYNPGDYYKHRELGLSLEQTADHADLSCMGMLVDWSTKFYGTGVLISDRVVLTAAHLFKYDNSKPDPQASNFRFIIKRLNDGVWSSTTYHVSEVHMHAGWTARLHARGGTGDGDLLGVDIGVAILSEPVPHVTPARLPMEGWVEPLGSLVMHAGYGVSTDASTGYERDRWWDTSKPLAGYNTLDRVRVQVDVPHVPAQHEGGVLATDYDDGTQQNNSLSNQYGTVGYIGSGDSSPEPVYMESTTCSGDSGGPLFTREDDGEWTLIGINSYGTEDPSVYSDISVYTRVQNHLHWIAGFIADTTTQPEPAGGEWTLYDGVGWMYVTSTGWVYHVTRGWMYMSEMYDDQTDRVTGGVWFWTSDIGWWWTDSDVYPHVWSNTHESWMYVDTERSDHSQTMVYVYRFDQWRVIVR